MKSLFRCPLCASPLEREANRWSCPAGHSFDRASAGYVHLLPANQKHSKDPGDDKAMVAARSAFLEKGYYQPLREALCQAVTEYAASLPAPVVLDSGCGEGYYTAGLSQALPRSRIAGVDLSKAALRRAAKRVPEGEFAVASVYRLPLAGGSADVLTNIFSPLAIDEFARVLRPGGLFCYAVPSPRHLWQMKAVLYKEPYENPVKREDYPGFVWREVREIRYTAALDAGADILALFHMTPYAWKTPREGVARLEALDRLRCEIGFDLHLYQKI
ncbi:23S rRNA (guanine(745)-N(1))-methyltransferase [Firmicutes bacterium ASF500]|nr:23S rRNA (guanine(745)-N(1))-methyltransferase [Firmicutes bacterium ASF500]